MIVDLLTMLPSKNKKNIIFEKLEYQFEINVVEKNSSSILIFYISLLPLLNIEITQYKC